MNAETCVWKVVLLTSITCGLFAAIGGVAVLRVISSLEAPTIVSLSLSFRNVNGTIAALVLFFSCATVSAIICYVRCCGNPR